MQTFLPYEDFVRSAAVLDNRRLNKQRLEGRQIVEVLRAIDAGVGEDADETPDPAWARHPAVLMWKGHEGALLEYCHAVEDEWAKRGFRSSTRMMSLSAPAPMPWWFGHPKFHSSHRAALLAKDHEHYGRFGWVEVPRIDYWWPSWYAKQRIPT